MRSKRLSAINWGGAQASSFFLLEYGVCYFMENKPDQLDRFREAAAALECDDDATHFDAKLKKVAKAPKPKDDETKE